MKTTGNEEWLSRGMVPEKRKKPFISRLYTVMMVIIVVIGISLALQAVYAIYLLAVRILR
jgi:hypothetical protein